MQMHSLNANCDDDLSGIWGRFWRKCIIGRRQRWHWRHWLRYYRVITQCVVVERHSGLFDKNTLCFFDGQIVPQMCVVDASFHQHNGDTATDVVRSKSIVRKSSVQVYWSCDVLRMRLYGIRLCVVGPCIYEWWCPSVYLQQTSEMVWLSYNTLIIVDISSIGG